MQRTRKWFISALCVLENKNVDYFDPSYENHEKALGN